MRGAARSAVDYVAQLATLVTDAPAGDAWLHEQKFDGYRIGLRKDGPEVSLWRRRGNDWAAEIRAVADAGAALAARRVALDGEDLRQHPIEERKDRLRALLEKAGDGVLRFSDHVRGDGPAFFAQACKLGLEGVVSKRLGAPYRPGRNLDWVKTKCLRRQEFVVGGYTDPEGSREAVGSLLLGVFAEGGLRWAGADLA